MARLNIRTQPSCQHPGEASELSVSDARDYILQTISPVACHERLALRSALNHVLATDIISPIDVPAQASSAMDGYALSSADLPTDGIVMLRVTGTAWAGRSFTETVNRGEAVRIMTGGVMPTGTDTVIMQEHVETVHEQIRIGSGHRPGQNVRLAGEDIGQGKPVLHKGKYMLPPDLGLLASLGIGDVHVVRPLRVAFFSSGDELRAIGDALEEGQIYDSNRYTLYGMLKRLGVHIIDMGVVADDRSAIRHALQSAATHADAVITSGGVSVGEADYIREILQELGEVKFWKIAMKPGRPLAYGKIRQTPFFGLPGNPVSVMVTFYQFVQPALKRMMGQTDNRPLRLQACCESAIKKRPGRTEFQRGILSADAEGKLQVHSTGQQGSGMLSSMSAANCFIILPEDSDAVGPGSMVEVEPFEFLM